VRDCLDRTACFGIENAVFKIFGNFIHDNLGAFLSELEYIGALIRAKSTCRAE